MKIIERFVTRNKCYLTGAPLRPQGIMLHSVGVAQPNASVFAQNFNQYKPGGSSVCVHAFVQRDGTVYQTLPWNMVAWHCGGAANQTHIGIEMTEPASIAYQGGASWADRDHSATEEHVRGTYSAAVELFAQLCLEYNLDPLADGVILSHAEGAQRGIASNHGDPEHIWRVFGLTMDGFRRDVYAAMQIKTDEEDENMTRYNTVAEMPEYYRAEAQALIDAGALKGGTDGSLNISEDMLRCMIISKRYMDTLLKGAGTEPSGWATDELAEAVEAGITDGSRPKGYATREEAAIMVKRASYGNVEELGG